MTSFISYLLGGKQAGGIDLPSVTVHSVETDPDRRARCLKHLLKANHVNYSLIYNNLRFDNHNVHILCSAYLLGATEAQLYAIYDSEIQELEPWVPSPSELIEEDWRDFWGDRRYQRAFVDFFEDQLALKFAYDWKHELRDYLLSGERPLLHGLIGGLGHPLIQLAYAYEMNNREVAMEALALASSQYNFFHRYLDDRSPYTKPSPIPSDSPLELLKRASKDDRFGHLPENMQLDYLETLFEENEPLIMEYWNALELGNPKRQFEACQRAAVALLVATVRPGTDLHNFFIVHLLTTSHAIRVLLSFLPEEHHVTLVREWWLLTLGVFIIKGRPMPDGENVRKELGGKGKGKGKGETWKHVTDRALNSEWSKDAHFVKAIRAMKEAAETWGDDDGCYLQSAVTFADSFRGWSH